MKNVFVVAKVFMLLSAGYLFAGMLYGLARITTGSSTWVVSSMFALAPFVLVGVVMLLEHLARRARG